ncbi:Hypothetical predicted protein [Mytilus galloprovincialis]|uniref:Nab N-terminal domain-containing protein n=1 Tax=Mytilus galloprovincialis TaxID=29158 RepID=A0A8B6EYE9_MYTGA|nr:Hypothetical predicted protein [Mytilus galloprovincialis]
MASNEPQNLLEWQLHCVLKRASLLQYYESFMKHGECDVLQLSEADDGKFKDVMEKVGMAKKSIHVRLFKSTLLQWAKDPGKDKHVPSYIKKSDDSTSSPAQGSLKPDTVSFSMPGKYSEVPQLQKSIQELEIKTKEKEELLSYTSEKKKAHPKEDTTQKYTQSVIKDQEHHEHHDLTWLL